MLLLNPSKRWSPRHYLVCPNPQTCDDAFEWVEPRESDFERKKQEAVSGGKGKEMGKNQDSDEDFEEGIISHGSPVKTFTVGHESVKGESEK